MKIVVTGGAGFIGSAVIRNLIASGEHEVLNVDKLTYAADLRTLAAVTGDPRYAFERLDICDREGLARVFANFKPDAVMHLAAESHVDRSIDTPSDFIETNVVGTYCLLEAARAHCASLSRAARAAFRFLHVSTDEVYGALGPDGRFTEETPYAPNSPYSATKASSDHLARAWFHTYGLPVLITHSGNNYGPYQFPEKLIPLMILKGLAGEALPVYGNGANVRDWIHVDDHACALIAVLARGEAGGTYNVGASGESSNRKVVESICDLLDEIAPDNRGSHRDLITFVPDRPGHDFRYAIDNTRIKTLGWKPRYDFASGLRDTVKWYLDNRAWWEPLLAKGDVTRRLGLPREDGAAPHPSC